MRTTPIAVTAVVSGGDGTFLSGDYLGLPYRSYQDIDW